MENSKKAKYRHPLVFTPSLYFAQGLPNAIISGIFLTTLYKNLGVPNTLIAFYTSLLYWPWALKMFWGPLVDIYLTKRTWIVMTQLAMVICLGIAAFSVQLPSFLAISLVVFTVAAFISATHDIAADGFYMLAFNKETQAAYTGIRSLFFRLSVIFSSGVLVALAGFYEKSTQNIPLSWTISLGVAALIFAGITLYHQFVLPFPVEDTGSENQKLSAAVPVFAKVIISYFQQPYIFATLAFILLYRFGEAMLVKIASLFLIDTPEAGGLGLSTTQLSLVYGTVGVIALIAGGILGGVAIARFGLKKSIWPMALALNLPDLFYVYMAYTKPSIDWVYPLVAIEQFGYGLGFTAFMVYLMYICKGEYKTSHYAISTGIMAFGLMIPGAVSGVIQEAVGYPLFFILVCFATIPGMLTLLFLPLETLDQENSYSG
jgi:PAT family beta-lactamase induction signal transducer AmpG